MALTGTTNTAANTAIRYLTQNQMQASSSLGKLSSGSRIVKASDDAASLAVGTKIKADVTALKQGANNAAQASSLLQVADGGMSRIADILQRMKALSVQAQSGSVTDNERSFLDEEYQALSQQVDDIASQTKFNGSVLLNGTAANSLTLGTVVMASGTATGSLSGAAATGTYTVTYDGTDTFTLTKPDATTDTVQVTWDAGQVVFDGSVNFRNAGVTVNFSNMDITDNTVSVGFDVTGGSSMSFQVGVSSADTIVVSIDDVQATALGINGTDITTNTNAIAAGNALDTAISDVNSARAGMGALLSRFEFVSANLATSVENLDAARSTLMDVDIAAEMSKFTSLQVLTQAGVAMLAQANQMPQNLLRLLQ
ncbi:MAG: flagellin [Geminicoccaceae bacterium]